MGMADFVIAPRHQRLLAALLLHPDRSYSYNDLIRIGGTGRGATQKALAQIIQSGAALATPMGNQRRIQANIEFPIYRELRSICLKTFGVRERIEKALEPFRASIDQAFVFGSVAKATDGPTSDVDLMIVGDAELSDVLSSLEDAERDIGRHIHLTLYNRNEWPKISENVGIQRILRGPKMMVINGDQATRLDEEPVGVGIVEGGGSG